MELRPEATKQLIWSCDTDYI